MTETELVVQREDHAGQGRYVIRIAPGLEAEMIFSKAGDGPMVITHTEVPEALEGRGIASRLVKAAVADARAGGFKITPLCTYVAAQFPRHS